MYCFDKKTGNLLWKFKTLGKIEGSPVISGDEVIFGSGDGRIYRLELETGKKIWSYEIGSPVQSTIAVVKDIIVVSCRDGKVYCFGKK